MPLDTFLRKAESVHGIHPQRPFRAALDTLPVEPRAKGSAGRSRARWNAQEAATTDRRRGLEAFGDTADGLYVVDRHQRIVRWNLGAQRLLGYTLREVLNRPCHEVIASRNRYDTPVCGPDCPVHRRVECGELPKSMQVHVRTKDGRWKWLHLSVIVIPHDAGPLTAHVLHDVSDQEQVSEVFAQVASLYEAHNFLPGDDGTAPAGARTADGSAILDAPGVAYTTREREVLRLLADGLSTKAIAARLSVSPHTVRNHVQHVLAKSGAHSRAEVVSRAFRRRLL